MNEITYIPREKLFPSRTNPRKKFDPDKLKELAGTIKEQGVLLPLLVRQMPPGPKSTGPVCEIVAGERRWRASELAGLAELPCIIKTLTDQQVLEIQYIENLQRDDLTDIEEAEGFAKLIKSGAYTAESLADKLGRSRAYVFARLRLARLQGPARAALENGSLPTTIGNLAAQLPGEKLQRNFVMQVLKPKHEDEPLSFRSAEKLLKRDFIRNLGGQFDMKATDLGCGSCMECPKRSGNIAGFDGGNSNVCTDVECFEAKIQAHGKKLLKEAKAKGEKVVSLAEWKELGYRARDQYCQPNDCCYHGEKAYGKQYSALLGKDLPKVLVHTDEGVKELVDRKAAMAKLEEKALLKSERRGKTEAQKKEERDNKILLAARERAMHRLVEAMENPVRANRLDAEFHQLLCSAILNGEIQIYDSFERAAKRRGIEPIVKEHKGWKEKDLKKPFLTHLSLQTTIGVRALLAELILGNSAYGYRDETHFERACKLWSVDLKAVEREVRAEFDTKKKGKPALSPARAEQNGKIVAFRKSAGIPLANKAAGKDSSEPGLFTAADQPANPRKEMTPAARRAIAEAQRQHWANKAKAEGRATA